VIQKIPAFLAHSQCKALARNDPYLHWHFIFRLAFWWLNWHPETTDSGAQFFLHGKNSGFNRKIMMFGQQNWETQGNSGAKNIGKKG